MIDHDVKKRDNMHHGNVLYQSSNKAIALVNHQILKLKEQTIKLNYTIDYRWSHDRVKSLSDSHLITDTGITCTCDMFIQLHNHVIWFKKGTSYII